MVSCGEIREMFKGGISFGAHTLTHPDLTRVPFGQLESEVSLSKKNS
jgi:peptidoglycan/xylan/chitin deacetylase (PgdA/CDA1 family)